MPYTFFNKVGSIWGLQIIKFELLICLDFRIRIGGIKKYRGKERKVVKEIVK